LKLVTTNEFDGIDKLNFTELPTPLITGDEVLIKIKAVSTNPVDVSTTAGSAKAKHLKHYSPLILGWDVSVLLMKSVNKAPPPKWRNFN